MIAYAQSARCRWRIHSVRSLGGHGALVLPKLFRRCVRYLSEGAREPFRVWLARGEDDGVIVDGRAAPTRLSRILAEDGAAVRVTVELTRMTLVER